jgi:hypothetical protein
MIVLIAARRETFYSTRIPLFVIWIYWYVDDKRETETAADEIASSLSCARV